MELILIENHDKRKKKDCRCPNMSKQHHCHLDHIQFLLIELNLQAYICHSDSNLELRGKEVYLFQAWKVGIIPEVGSRKKKKRRVFRFALF
jgi:hypothetical protein